MALVNRETKEVQFKIVYCGPSMGGKTTNLQHIHSRIDDDRRGDLVQMATSTDRKVFWDYLPIDAVLIKGYQTRFNLYTVPGKLAYAATAQLILRGADAIVFVVNSADLEASLENLKHLFCSLEMIGVQADELPWVTQCNRSDDPEAIPRETLVGMLGLAHRPSIEAVVSQGYNVFATLNVVAEECLNRFHAGEEGR